MKPNYIYLSTFLLLALPSCTDDSISGDGLPGDGSRKEVRLQASIDQTNVSRADDSGFSDGDRIGIFAVNFTDGTNPGTLTPADNLASNVGFSFNEASNSWEGDRQLYFKDDKTPVDFYGYYPYDYDMAEVEAYPFSVQRNQAAEAAGNRLSGYEASDFLWAKSAGVTPATPLVTLTFKHILAGVQVTLVEGTGFEEGEWAMLDKSVLVAGTNRDATINLATGETTLAGEGDDKSIIANPYRDDYRAVVIPQSVEAGNTLLSITVDGQSYEFTKEMTMTYLPSKLHKFTIQVEKPLPEGDFEFSLLDEAITAWESDLTSHNGSAKEYIIVNVAEAGGLENAIKEAKLTPSELINLKITGELTASDFHFMRTNMKYLEALNLKEVILRNCELEWGVFDDYALPNDACNGLRHLTSVVLPDKLIKIGELAFRNTNLSGSLVLPEGLEYIGNCAFDNWQDYTQSNTNLSGTLTLPTTLKHVGYRAFNNCDFTGTLVLPEGLEYIGEAAFADCRNMTGELHLPSTLKVLEHGAFANTKFKGNFDIPKHLTEIKPFFFSGMTSFTWPEAPTSISEESFCNTSLRGDIIIPETITHIGRAAFAGTNLSHIVFPQNLEFIEQDVCSWNKSLQDTVVIPPLIETIGERAFAECEKLDAVILPKNLQWIRNEAFRNCYSLSYIHCQATVPPMLEESAFYGVNKDNFTVEVPEESVDAYRNAPGWREFKRIASYRNFIARPAKYNVLNKGGKKEIILNADAEWELVDIPSWCHLDKTSGTQKTTLTLTVDMMAHGQGNRTGEISFRLKDSEEHVTHINIGQYDYEHDEDSYVLIQKATKGEGIDLFFCGDGYDAIDISAGLYLQDMQQEMEYLFAVEPYTTYREYFNVYTSFAMSEDSGVETLNTWRTTKFHTCIGDGSTRLSTSWMDVLNYCSETVPPITDKTNPAVGAILVVNTNLYEGITYSIGDSNTFCAVVTKSTEEYPNDARGLIQHEAGGHGIGWLADEYMYHAAFLQKCTCSCCGHVEALKENHATGFGLNLSLTGRYKDVPWSHLIFNPDYGDIVDIYEGGYFHTRGVYRSEHNSCMNNNVPYFSTWSRQLIVQRIMNWAGEEFTLDNFYANDSRETGRDFTSTSRSGDINVYTPTRHRNAPVRINNYKFGKKGAKR